MLRFLAIPLLCIGAAIAYGIFHDQITARICADYFTIGHPPVFGTDDPTLLGLGWGVVATWWVGLIIGVPLAIAARAGPWPKWTAGRLVRPLAIVLGTVVLVAATAGVARRFAAARGWVWLVDPLNTDVPADRHVAFLTDLWIHLASYLAGGLGGLAPCVWVVARRVRASNAASE